MFEDEIDGLDISPFLFASCAPRGDTRCGDSSSRGRYAQELSSPMVLQAVVWTSFIKCHLKLFHESRSWPFLVVAQFAQERGQCAISLQHLRCMIDHPSQMFCAILGVDGTLW